MFRGYYDDGLDAGTMDDQTFNHRNDLEQSKISRGHHHVVIISHTDTITQQEDDLIKALKQIKATSPCPTLRIFSVHEWAANNTCGDKRRALLKTAKPGLHRGYDEQKVAGKQ